MTAESVTAKRFRIAWPTVVLILALLGPRIWLARGAFIHPDRSTLTDSWGYLELASNLREHGRFQASAHEESLRTPAYPVFLALVQGLFGEHLGFVILFQVSLGLGIAWLLFRAGRELAGPAVGIAVAWAYALDPNALFWSATVMTETLFAFWVALALCLFVGGIRRQSLVWSAGSGLSLGLAALTRPIGVYLIPLWLLGTVLVLWNAQVRRRLVAQAAAFLLLAMLPLLAWQTRNLLVHGEFRLSASSGTVFVDYLAANTLGDALGISRDDAATRLRQSADPFGAAVEAVRAYPVSFVRVSLQGLVRTALGTEAGTWVAILTGGEYRSSGLLESILRGDFARIAQALSLRLGEGDNVLGTILLLWGVVFSCVVYVGALKGLLRLKAIQPEGHRWVPLVVLVSMAYLLIAPLSIGDARFRVPAEPLLAFLGGLGLSRPRPASQANASREGA